MEKNKHFSLAMLVLLLSTLFCVSVKAFPPYPPYPRLINLEVRFDNPIVGGPVIPRSPVEAPEVYIENYTLTFDSSCHNCTLRIVNTEDEVEYTTIITSDTLVLPSTLVGQYEIQIIRDNWCFYGDIEL